MSFKKEDITATLSSNEGSAMFVKGKSLKSNNSNDECNSIDVDFIRGALLSVELAHCTAIMLKCT